jgi:hypothetical protein
VEGVETLLQSVGRTVQSSEDWQKVKQLAERIRLVEDVVLEKGYEYNRLNMARIAEEMKREEETTERASTAEDGDVEVVDRMVRLTATEAFVSDGEAAEGEGERRVRLNRVNQTRVSRDLAAVSRDVESVSLYLHCIVILF